MKNGFEQFRRMPLAEKAATFMAAGLLSTFLGVGTAVATGGFEEEEEPMPDTVGDTTAPQTTGEHAVFVAPDTSLSRSEMVAGSLVLGGMAVSLGGMAVEKFAERRES